MASTQDETKFVREQEKYSLVKKNELRLDKNATSPFIPTPYPPPSPNLIHFALFFNFSTLPL